MPVRLQARRRPFPGVREVLRAFRDFGAANLLQAGIAREDTGGEWAPFIGPHVCLDDAGRWRGRHEVVGESCVFCRRRPIMELEAV